MQRRISFLIFKYLTVFAFLVSFTKVHAADEKKPEVFVPLYQGINIGVELTQPAMSLFTKSGGYSVTADVNLKNKVLPGIELGVYGFDKTSEAGVNFKATGPFMKIGAKMPLTVNGKKAENIFFVGLNYAVSYFKYDLYNVTIPNGYWDGLTTDLTDEKSLTGWVEGIAGLRVNVIGPFALGWSVVYKSVLHNSDNIHGNAPYIPGYGMNVKPNLSVNAYLYYRLPF